MKHDNALNFLRLVFAALVVVNHSGPVLGLDDRVIAGDTIGGWAVAGFFAISGYLITSSRDRLTLAAFLWRRCLRIYPAFWVCLSLVAFGFAPLSARLTGDSWSAVGAVSYVFSNATLLVRQSGVPDTLSHTAYPTMWNLSLWTLAYEFGCYLLTALVRWRRTPLLGNLGVALLFAAATALSQPGVKARVPIEVFWAGKLGAFFFAGALLFTLRDRIALLHGGAVFALASFTALIPLHLASRLGALPLAYLVLWVGVTLPIRWGSVNDISYGVYIYGFPVQQLASSSLPSLTSEIALTVMTLGIVAPLAWGSWLVVERPAMRLKSSVSRHQRIVH